MDSLVVLLLVAALATVGICVDSAERISANREIVRAFGWEILASSHPKNSAWQRVPWVVVSWSETRLGTYVIHLARTYFAGATVLLLAFGSVTLAAISALVVTSLQVVVQTRLSLGLDGADQMQFLIWLGVALSGVSLVAGLTLIAGQSLLSYLVAGWAKVGGKVWRTGQAPSVIVATIGHGSPSAYRAVSALTLPIAYGTMAFETLGPVLAFLGGFSLLCFVVTALGFHAGIAWAMGLNNFAWAFAAALPAVVWLVTSVSGRGIGL